MRLTYNKYKIYRGVTKVKTRTALVLSAIGLVMGGGGLSLANFVGAHADSAAINFENPPYVLGNINGQDGWAKTGPYDVVVTNNTYGYAAFGSQSLRISNAVTSGSFGDQTFSKSLANEAGEPDALNAGQSGGTRQPHFEAQFDVASTSAAQQPGLFMSVSPDRGDGARMSYVGFDDQADGVHVIFYDVTNPTHAMNATSFNQSDIATLSRTPHTIKLAMDFVSGPDNDVVNVYIDGALRHTGTSWENYYRFDTESNPGLAQNDSRTVDSLLFRVGGAAVPANAGNGYLVDNLSLVSGATPLNLPISKDQCTKDGWKNYGTTFKNQGDCVSFVATQGKNQPAGTLPQLSVTHSAVGDVTLSAPEQSLSFAAYDNGASAADSGWVTYSNPGAGLTYAVPPTCVNVAGTIAYFAYQIPADAPVAANVWVVWKVVDNGATDTAGFTTAADMAGANAICEAGSSAVTNYAIVSGDIKVQ